jgi:putative hydrolase of the HAD superfamily
MIDWKEIDTVFLDMDGTLLDLHFDNHFWQELIPQKYAQRHQLSIDQAKAELVPLFKSMEGKLEWYCLDYWSDQLKLDIPAIKVEVASLISVLPHALDFLKHLKQSRHRVLLVTNAHQKTLGIKIEKTCLQHFFDDIICSHDLGLPKENPQFWQCLQVAKPFQKQHTLLIDDSLAVLNSARNYGINHLLSINKPDSQLAQREIAGFLSIRDFREIMPAL